MTIQETNKQVVRDYFERCWNQKDLDCGQEFMIDDYNFHMPITAPDFPRGYNGWRMGVGMYLQTFPDCHWDVRQIIAEGDLVFVRTVWTGTHSKEYMGVPASGKRVEVANIDIYRMANGKFVEHWDIPDYMAVFKQIGGLSVAGVNEMYAGSTEG
jgi:steroid delta-isomerase-like uncharacterized protein